MWRVYELSGTFQVGGDYSEFPAELEQLLADPYLGWMRTLFEEGKQGGWHAPEGAYPDIRIAPLSDVTKDGSEVALQVCMDAREVPKLDGSGNLVANGRLSHDEVFLKRFDGVLKVFTGTTQGVESCPF